MENKIKTIRPEIIQQLLFAKWLLSQEQIMPEAKANPFSIAKKILTAHNAAEIGIAAIADQIEALPDKEQRFLMDYFSPIKKQTGDDIQGKEYCRQLNTVRKNLKHGMILPDSSQWITVCNNIYSYLSKWCQTYLETSLNDIDNSLLIHNKKIKSFYDDAKKEAKAGNYQQTLELLGKALCMLFEENNALRAISVGKSRAEDAIKLAAFGVHSNDYLALQEFLPEVIQASDGYFSIRWTQENFGHPGNWREESVSFCMNVFLDLALKIQDASWIPGPIPFQVLYEYKIEAVKDNVEIWNEGGWESNQGWQLVSPGKNIVKRLKKGESILAMISREKKTSLDLFGLYKAKDGEPEKIYIYSKELRGYVKLEDVKISCVPRDSSEVKEYFPNLPVIDMQLD